MSQELSGYWSRPIRRRRLVVAGATSAAAAALLAACGGSNNNKSTAATKAPTTAATAATAAGASPAATAARSSATSAAASPTQAAASPTAAGALPPPNGQKGGILRGQIPNVFDSTDVHRALGDPTLWTSNYLYNKLVMYANPDLGTLEPDLAEKYEAPDPATYTFSLRKNVKWQPPISRPFTSADVRWHIERQANGKLLDGSDGGFTRQVFYKTITKLETPDDFTVKLTLATPNGTFLDRLAAYFSTLPNKETTEKFEATHRTLTEEAMVGTGPFICVQLRAGQEVKFKRNPDYFKPNEPLLDGWLAPLIFEDPVAYRAAFLQKQVEGWGSPDPSQTKAVIDQNKGAMTEVLTGVGNTVALIINRNTQFKDMRLIKAMNQAIDRQKLIQTFHQGLGQNSGIVTWLQEGFAIPPEELGKLPGYRNDRNQELKEARDLWAAGGGPALGDVDITIPVTWLAQWPDTPQIISKMFNDNLGVSQFKSSQSDYNKDIIPNLGNGKFPHWFGWISQVNSPDPRSDLRNSFHSKGSTNYNKVGLLPGDPNLDDQIDKAVTIVDHQQAITAVRAIQDVIMSNAMFGNITLYNYISRTAYWNYYHPLLKAAAGAGKPGAGFNIFAGHLLARYNWMDTKDPSYQGRPPAAL